LDVSALQSSSEESIKNLISYLKQKQFGKMREWVASNCGMDGATTIRAIYDSMNDEMSPKSIPSAVLILAEYSYKASMVADKELNLVACMTELMKEIEWK
jgi:replication factor C small subunit